MAEVYQYCTIADECVNVSVNMSIYASCNFYYKSPQYPEPDEEYVEVWQETIRFTLSAPTTVPLRVYYNIWHVQDWAWSGYIEEWLPWYVDIPSGVTTYDYTYDCQVIRWMDMSPGGGWGFENDYYSNPVLQPQPAVPDCCIYSPPECSLDIYSGTTVNPIILGEATGSITIYVSGATGTSVTYKINGTTITTSGAATGYTFTGLTSGAYTVLAEEGECQSQEAYDILDGEFRTKAFGVVEPKFAATENPIILSLATGVNSLTPAYGKSTFEVTGTINDGDSITITLEYPQSYVAVFTAKYFPNRDDYFMASTLKNSVGTSVGTNTTSEIAKSIEECFQKDVILSRLYDFRASGDYVYATAKEYNDNLNLNISTVAITGNITCTETVTGITQYDGQLSQNYSLYADILVNTAVEYGEVASIDTFKKVAQIELPFNSQNIHFFDVAPILKNFVSTRKIDYTFTGHTTFPMMICSYYLEYGEKYPLIQNETTKKSRVKGTSSQLFCINSSLDWTEVNDMSAYVGSASTSPSGYTTDVKFLTDAPYTKYVNRDSSEFSFFIVPADYGKTLTVVGDLYFYDGSVLTGQTLITISGITFGGVYGVATGYRELKLNTYEVLTGGTTRKVRRVDFAVYQSDSANTLTYTETRSYRYEIDEMPRRYGVSFLNSKGTWDIFDFNGEIVNDVNFTNEKMEVAREISVGGDSPKGFMSNKVYGTKVTRKIAANSGWLDEEHFNWLINLLGSNVIYCYTEEEQPFLLVDSVNYQKSSNDDLYNIDVTFIETLHINNISV